MGYMNNLGLPHPKKMDAAVPANLACGRPADLDSAPKVPDWGPVTIEGATNIPLSTLRDRVDEIPRNKPVVFLCPSGARSAIATTVFEKAGGERVANMRGGLIEWHPSGLPLKKS